MSDHPSSRAAHGNAAYQQLLSHQDLFPEEMLDLGIQYIAARLEHATPEERGRLQITQSLLQTIFTTYSEHINLARMIAYGYLRSAIADHQRELERGVSNERLRTLSALYDALRRSLGTPVRPDILAYALSGQADRIEPEEYTDDPFDDDVPF